MSVHHMMHCVRSAGVGDWAQAHLQQGKGGPLYDYQLQVGQASETHLQCFTHFHHLMHTKYWSSLSLLSACIA